jgi:hypothetical protein
MLAPYLYIVRRKISGNSSSESTFVEILFNSPAFSENLELIHEYLPMACATPFQKQGIRWVAPGTGGEIPP